MDDVIAMMDPMLAAHVNSRWLALRLLEKDHTVFEALREYLTERDMPQDTLMDGILALAGR